MGRRDEATPFVADPQFFTALGRSVLPAITELASALSAADSGLPHGFESAAVRASVTEGAGGPVVQAPGTGCSRCVDWERRRDLYGEAI